MSILSTSKTSKTANPKNEREPSEFDGVWLNVGAIRTNADGVEEFERVSRGIAVADLEIKKLFPKMGPEFVSAIKFQNLITTKIQQAALKLQEGESKLSDVLVVQIYRRNEELPAETEVETPTDLELF